MCWSTSTFHLFLGRDASDLMESNTNTTILSAPGVWSAWKQAGRTEQRKPEGLPKATVPDVKQSVKVETPRLVRLPIALF
jgi:hypothetical protein